MFGKKINLLFTQALIAVFFIFVCAAFDTTVSAQQTTVSVSPTSVSVPISGERQISAHVSGAANASVVWTVNDIPGGNSQVGTIDANGKYIAPPAIPAGGTVTIKATSIADNTASAVCVATIRNQVSYVTAVSPNPLAVGKFTITVTGSRFVSGAQVFFNNQALQTIFVSATQLTANGTAAQAGNATVFVANPGGGAVSTPLSIQITSSITVVVSPSSANVAVGGAKQFQATVGNSPNQAVTWSINNIAGGNSQLGTIDASGLYTAPLVQPLTSAVTVTATSAADNYTKNSATITIDDPQAVTIGRFLDQSSFGATPQTVARVKQLGFPAYLTEQFSLPESAFPDPLTATTGQAVDRFFFNAANGQDQLRQRMIYALSQIFVTSRNKNAYGNQTIPWLQVLSRNAFGNYRTLIKEMTLDASMGAYLDLANSNKPQGNYSPNENYARELMQLFTIGLYKLNQDGSLQLDSDNQPIPTYSQTDVRQLALALSGWTYPTPPGQTPRALGNMNYYPGAMEPRPANHAVGAKSFLGGNLAGTNTIQQDLDGAVDIIFNHPNVAPFVATRLIRALVTSNPSPDYVARVSAVFNDNGAGVRGDMQAVIRAILLDREARDDNPPANFGKLRSPMLQTISLFRALGANVTEPIFYAYDFYSMGEPLLAAPSVFGHYSPLFRLPSNPTLVAPEFQIYTPTEAVNRANFTYNVLSGNGFSLINLAPFINIASDPVQLVNAIDNRLLYGRMSSAMRQSIYQALQSAPDNRTRALTALYLTVTSGDYLVQH